MNKHRERLRAGDSRVDRAEARLPSRSADDRLDVVVGIARHERAHDRQVVGHLGKLVGFGKSGFRRLAGVRGLVARRFRRRDGVEQGAALLRHLLGHLFGTAIVACMYVPATIMVLLRPNEGAIPEWLERRIARWPLWLRGRESVLA